MADTASETATSGLFSKKIMNLYRSILAENEREDEGSIHVFECIGHQLIDGRIFMIKHVQSGHFHGLQ